MNKKTNWERLADLVGSAEATRLIADVVAHHTPKEPARAITTDLLAVTQVLIQRCHEAGWDSEDADELNYRALRNLRRAIAAAKETPKKLCYCGDEMYTCGKGGCKEMPEDSGPPADEK